MIIGVDAGMLGITDKRLKVGVYWVAVHLLEHLSKIDSKNTYRLYSFDPIDAALLKRFGPRMTNLVLRPKKGWFMVRLPLELLLHPVDAFLALGQSVPFAKTHIIGFVYDLGFFQHPHFYPASAEKMGMMTNNLMQRADAIVTISETVKQDVQSEYHVAEDSITVAYPGVDESFSPKGVAYKADKPYFLYVGSLKRGKNIPTLISSFAELSKAHDAELYLVGSDYWLDPAIHIAIASSGMGDRVKMLGYVPDERLSELYRGAVAFASPSLVEGFCLPVVEAMSSGCPVIVSDIPVFTEVVGNAGTLVKLTDPDGLTRAMAEHMKKGVRDEFGKKGLAQAKKYTWSTMAKIVSSLL